MRALRSVGEKMNILICDGYDPSEIEAISPSPSLTISSDHRYDSISSIDRDDYDPNTA